MDSVKIYSKEIGWDGMDWIDVAHDRSRWRVLENKVMKLQFPQNVGNFLSSCTIGGVSRRAQLHDIS
jgi:hypothetical protein